MRSTSAQKFHPLAVACVLGILVGLTACPGRSHAAGVQPAPPDAGAAAQSAAKAADELRKQRQDLKAGQQIRGLGATPEVHKRHGAAGERQPEKGWGGRAFEIHRIVFDNDTPRAGQRAIMARFVGRRLGARQIVELVRALDDSYSAAGYITTVVTVPAQNLSAGELRLRVEWGRVRFVKWNGRRERDLPLRERIELQLAMPGIEGSILNIRTLDQMVQNLSTQRKVIHVKIEPTKVLNQSDIDIQETRGKAVEAGLTLDNSGSERKDGHYKTGLQLSTSDLFGLNGRLTFLGGYRFFDHRDGSEENTVGLDYMVPIGFWSVEGSYSLIHTRTLLPTIYGTYHSKSTLKQSSLKVSRIVFRDARHVATAWSELLVRNNANYFEGQLIDVSSKSYTQFSLGLTNVLILRDGYLYSDVSWARGVPWLSGYLAPSVDNGPSSEYDLVRGTMIWQKRRLLPKISSHPFVFTLRGAFQWTKTPLLGLDKFMFGDQYTVRGFKDDPFSADKGFYVSSTLSTSLAGLRSVSVAPYVGLDMGAAKNNPDLAGWEWGTALSVGVSLSGRAGSLTLGVGAPLAENIVHSRHAVLYLSASMSIS